MTLIITNRLTADQKQQLENLEYYGTLNLSEDDAAKLIQELWEHKRIVDREERRSSCEAAIWRFYGCQEREPWMHDFDVDRGMCNNCDIDISRARTRLCPKSNKELKL